MKLRNRLTFPALLLISAAALSPAALVAQDAPAAVGNESILWSFEASDIAPDPEFHFGQLDNGMRFIIRSNGTPEGTGMVRMLVDSGAIAEAENERGYAHFIEHMAFNGSTNVPEGEMVKLLEREGLAFGADTNASTGFDTTTYMLDLPRNDEALLDTALMLMRETASELSFNPDAVEREKGVILSERRVRDTFALQNYMDQIEFLYPDAQYVDRLPIGTVETLQAADPEALKALWDRLYTPTNTTLVVVGDFDVAKVRELIEARFGDWAPEPHPSPVEAGPFSTKYGGATHINMDPALSEQVTVSRTGPWLEEPDSIADRRQDVLRRIGYGIVNRRLQRISRQENAPFRDAGLGTGGVFEEARTTNLVVSTGDGEWREGLLAAAAEYRRALEFGFTEAEVAEQVANLRTAIENAVAGAETRSNAALMGSAMAYLSDKQIPTTPQSGLERFNAMQEFITPENVLAALKTELVPLDDPLIRFEGRTAPEGAEAALRAAWDEAIAAPLEAAAEEQAAEFAYIDFGPPGAVVSDEVEPPYGIRQLRFDNGVLLNLKVTDLAQDRVTVQVNIDGGSMLDTKDNPLRTELVSGLPIGGLGAHSQDELQSVLAGRSVGMGISAEDETFLSSITTTPRDLELQLELLTAMITDPGYRTEGEVQFKRNIANYFARKDATPGSAIGTMQGEIISDGDPRFTLQPEEAYLALDFAGLKEAVTDRFEHGAIEIAMVGDFDEDAAIAMVARTFGALPQREAKFRTYTDNRDRDFTDDRSQRVIYHDGEADQAQINLAWPTRDDADLEEHLQLELLERVMRIELTDKLREELGQTYSPGVSASQSRTYPGYGTFTVSAAIDVKDVDATRAAIEETVAALIAAPVDDDVLLRARQPLVESYDNALKTNSGWMGLVDRAQSQPERITRYNIGKQTLSAITAEDIQAAAERYLGSGMALEILALPRPEAEVSAE